MISFPQFQLSDIQSRKKKYNRSRKQNFNKFQAKGFQKRSNTNISLPFLFPFFPNIIEYYIYSHGVQTTTPVVHLQVGNLIPRLSPPLPSPTTLVSRTLLIPFQAFFQASLALRFYRLSLPLSRFRRRGRDLSQRVAIIRFRRNEFRRRPVFA